MTWLQQIGAAFLLVVLTLCLQCAGVTALISWLRTVASDDIQKLRMSYSAALAQGTIITALGVLLSLALFSVLESCVLLSAASYSTVGYGDVVLPFKWRLLGPLESMMGVLMCGISVGLLFALITHLVERDPQLRTTI